MSQENIASRSELREEISEGSFTGWRMRMSSAYRNILKEKEGTNEAMSLKKEIKRRGPSTDPWGTPERTGRGEDRWFPMRTDCVRPERYEKNQEQRLGCKSIEYSFSKRDV